MLAECVWWFLVVVRSKSNSQWYSKILPKSQIVLESNQDKNTNLGHKNSAFWENGLGLSEVGPLHLD